MSGGALHFDLHHMTALHAGARKHHTSAIAMPRLPLIGQAWRICHYFWPRAVSRKRKARHLFTIFNGHAELTKRSRNLGFWESSP